jgi:quercetin dioxygenase-like cupin family protein
MKPLATALLAPFQLGQNITISRTGSQPSSQGDARYFTGMVRVETLFSALEPSRIAGARITFDPGARSAWHNHPLGQTLIVTQGTPRS